MKLITPEYIALPDPLIALSVNGAAEKGLKAPDTMTMDIEDNQNLEVQIN